jgi:hypothetical protein
MGSMFVSTTYLAPAAFVGYNAVIFNIIFVPSSTTVYNSLKTAGFLDRNILWNPTVQKSYNNYPFYRPAVQPTIKSLNPPLELNLPRNVTLGTMTF